MATPSMDYQFAFNGWLFGAEQGVQLLEAEGLEDMPTLRVQDDNRGWQDGMFTGRDFLNGRSIVLLLQIMNNANGSMQTYLSELKANLLYQQNGTGTLQFKLPGRPLQRVSARVRRRSLKIDPDYVYGRSTATVELFCPDPRIYDDAAVTQVLTPGSSVGRTYNRVYPLVYDIPLSGASSYVDFTNDGNVTVFPTFTLSGAMTNPRIVNSTTGQAIALNITMSATDTITVDPDLRSVTYNGNPARNLVSNTSQWFGFPPGITTVGIVVDTTTSGTCTVTYRNGYV